MKHRWIMGMACWLACGCSPVGDWAEIPRHSMRAGSGGGFELGKVEVTVAEFVDFLNESGGVDFPETAQIVRGGAGAYAAKRGMGRQAVAEVTPAEAEAYGQWLSRESGRTVRLPTEQEWEVAARGGVDGAPFPWGWGGQPAELARFDAEGPAPRGGRYVANGFGLYDMAGNLYEWCAPKPGLPDGIRRACGGSWAEHDPALLQVDHRQVFPADYRGRDVGFRVVRELSRP